MMKILNLFFVVIMLLNILIFLGCISNIPQKTTITIIETEITETITTTEMQGTTVETFTTFTTTTIQCNDSCVNYGFPMGFCLDECSENFIYVGNEGCDFEQKCCCFNFEFIETTTTSTTLKCNAKCCANSDCGVREVTHNYTCDANLIYTVYTDPLCKYPGTPSAQCIRVAERELLKRCDINKENCVENEPYCAFVSHGEYRFLEKPQNSQIFPITNSMFLNYDSYFFKIKYVISKNKKPDGLCIYVRSPDGVERKIYLTDRYGQWIDKNTRIGISKIFIYGSTISAEMWGMKQERI